MKTSLRKQLNDLIRERTYVPAEEIYRYCIEMGFRPSNGERRLRPSDSPNVVSEKAISKRGTEYIKGYWYRNIGERVPVAGIVVDERAIYNKDFLKNRKLETARIL